MEEGSGGEKEEGSGDKGPCLNQEDDSPIMDVIDDSELDRELTSLFGIGKSAARKLKKKAGLETVSISQLFYCIAQKRFIILQVRDLVCVYVEQCRDVDRFSKFIVDAGGKERTVGHVFEQLRMICAMADCRERCKKEVELADEGEAVIVVE